jgi:DNA-binding transcriptional MerR regulator
LRVPQPITIGEASRRSGWSARMLRYLEDEGLVVPSRTAVGYRRYGIRELNQLRALAELRSRFGVGLDELAFTLRLRREPELRASVETWLAGTGLAGSEQANPAWVEWEQRKHERLLASREAA